MTNREYLIKHTNIYDLLCKMQDNLEHCNKANIEPCIMDAIGLPITDVHYRHMKYNGDCSECIQAFMNESYNGGDKEC